MKRLVVSLIICMVVISSCSNVRVFKEENLNDVLKPFIEASQNDPTSYVNDLRYTLDDYKQIYSLAQKIGVDNPFLPIEGVATDYVIEVREEPDTLAIIYPHFGIRISKKDILPRSDGVTEKKVSSRVGELTWVYENDFPQILYMKQNGLYITISSAKPFERSDFEKVMESLVPLYAD